MSRQPFQPVVSTVILLPLDDIDTDQIIPARFLKGTARAGLGSALFADWRYDSQGEPRAEFVLNQPAARAAQVLLAGRNFGCGSSREHAPWALTDFGLRAIISTEFADIFRSNAVANSLLPIIVKPATHARLLAQVAADPKAIVAIDLETQGITLPDGTVETFPIDPFDRYCLLNGVDRLGFLLSLEPEIAQYEQARSNA
jgi:3-isopropylmalate/(R)-2-methylmalate dehydratase small subunit